MDALKAMGVVAERLEAIVCSSMKQRRQRFEIIDHATVRSWIRATYKVKYANTNRMHLDEPIEQCLVSRRPRPFQPQTPPPLPPLPWEPLSGSCPLSQVGNQMQTRQQLQVVLSRRHWLAIGRRDRHHPLRRHRRVSSCRACPFRQIPMHL